MIEIAKEHKYTGLEIAVIGMAGRFPGARNIQEYWDNLKNAIESVIFLTEKELKDAGVTGETLNNPAFVRSSGAPLSEKEKTCFDASFFGYTSLEAELMDPQMRIFHECAWEALEDAGYVPGAYKGSIGLIAGASSHIYWEALAIASGKSEELGYFASSQLTNKDSINLKTSFKLDLKGPVYTMHTACSTSLAAIHLAGQALLNGECDIALAGAVSLSMRSRFGYIYQEGMIYSSDGHCRAFDARANGTINGEGVGVVALKPLENAIVDRDNIYAIIKGTAINNDGMNKIGYTAPSITGQEAVIRMAQQVAEVEPDSISYIETHGTGTTLGDPIEIEALTRAFNTPHKKFCAIGSVKTNIGHLDTAAGVAGFIKTVLALKHRQIPPSLHFDTPNPKIDFQNSPFYVNTSLKEWENRHYPLRAGVSSFGIGGANVHAVLEEAPPIRRQPAKDRSYRLIVLSAKTPSALDKMTENLADYLKKKNDINLADVEYTLQVGRKTFRHRRFIVCRDKNDAIAALTSMDPRKVKTGSADEVNRPVIFMFPGLGSQYVDMGKELYAEEPVFRDEMNRCFNILKSVGFDIKEILYPSTNPSAAKNQPDEMMKRFEIAQAVIFTFSYSLAKLLMEWGIKPRAMIGYSFGELIAACVSGIFSLEDALKLVINRGQLISLTASGAMLSVPLAVEKVIPLLPPGLSLAIDNGPSCIVSGATADIDALERELKNRKYLCMRLEAERALHSKLMAPILSAFQSKVRQAAMNPPKIPLISNVTGNWITDQEAVDPRYWSTHLRETVRFADGIKKLLETSNAIFLEIGAGRDLRSLAQRCIDRQSKRGHYVIDLVRHSQKEIPDLYYLLHQIGRLWLQDLIPDWIEFHKDRRRYRCSLPPYPFEGKFYRLDGDIHKLGTELFPRQSSTNKKTDITDWFYIPVWEPSVALLEEPPAGAGEHKNWLVFIGESHFSRKLRQHLQRQGQYVCTVAARSEFSAGGEGEYWINPSRPGDYDALFQELLRLNKVPHKILHCWNTTDTTTEIQSSGTLLGKIEQSLDLGLYSLLNIAQAIGKNSISQGIDIYVLTNNMHEVTGEEKLCPLKATIIGAVKAIPLEYRNLHCTGIDISCPPASSPMENQLINRLMNEFIAGTANPLIAFRGNQRWVPAVKPLRLPEGRGNRLQQSLTLKENGVYLITGGSGGIGFTLAEYLARAVKAKLILAARSVFPRDKIKKIRELEESGAEIMIANADVSDEAQMETLAARVLERFGPVNGVIHAAGLPDYAGVIQGRTREMTENILAPKVHGTLVLDDILKDHPLDFFILCSSLTSQWTPPGQVGYCAANHFLDAFAHYKMIRDGTTTFTVSVNWDFWLEVGMGVKAVRELREKNFSLMSSHSNPEYGILPSEGAEVFGRIISLGNSRPFSQIAVSTRDISIVLEQPNTPVEELPQRAESEQEKTGLEDIQPRPELSSEYAAPVGKTETRLAAIWQRIFAIGNIGVHDDFFELGGDSLMAITVISKIHKELDVEVPLPEFFNRPTIQKMSAYIDNTQSSGCESINPVEKKEYYPLSSAQKRLYILQQMDLEGVVYNMPGIYILEQPLEKEKLLETFNRLITRHESLRTSFPVTGAEPVQKIHNPRDIRLDIQYHTIKKIVRPGPGLQLTEEAEKIIHDFVRPFNLTQPPLLRIGVINSAGNEQVLMEDMHHIISDVASHTILIKDFTTLYAGGPPPEMRIQYKDYSEWQRRNNLPVAGDEEKKPAGIIKAKRSNDYWREEFQGEIPALNLATDFTRPLIRSFEGKTLNFLIQSEESDAIKKMTAAEGVTSFMVILSLLNILLAKLSGQEDIVVGTDIEGRIHTDTRGIIGMFVNTLALRNFPAPGKTYKEFLGQVKDRTLKAFENQDYPFEDLVEKISVTRNADHNPIFDVMFSFMNVKEMEKQAGKLGTREGAVPEMRPYSYKNRTSKFDLTLNAYETDAGFFFSFEYCTKLFKEQTIARFTGYFQRLVTMVIKNPAARIGDIEILSREEQEHFLTVARNNKDKTFLKDLIKARQLPAEREADFDF